MTNTDHLLQQAWQETAFLLDEKDMKSESEGEGTAHLDSDSEDEEAIGPYQEDPNEEVVLCYYQASFRGQYQMTRRDIQVIDAGYNCETRHFSSYSALILTVEFHRH